MGLGFWTGLAIWAVILATTYYLFEKWQRFEPTRIPIDAAAAFFGMAFGFCVWVLI